LSQIHGSDFEVVQMGPVVTDGIGTPTGLHATAGAGSVALSWSATAGATSYLVKRSTSVAGPFATIVSNVTQTSGIDTGVTAGVTYYYVVSAVVGDNQSFDSDAASATVAATSNTAMFVKTDTATQGNWKGIYGKDGYSIASDATSLPGVATLAISGQTNTTWAASTVDKRALQKAGSTVDRIAACWTGGTFAYDLNLTDGQSHQIALYCLDWPSWSRTQRIDIVDAATGAILNSQTLSAFNSGKYLVWSITGHVKIKATAITGHNALVSGVFFR
jgi:hypothetical protein